MQYGYSMVGKVSRIGAEKKGGGETTSKPHAIGDRVFVFAPHGTHAVVGASSPLSIPANISSSDAVFFPSMETALNLVHDAAPLVGERVAVFGQGIIGMLVTAILSRMPLSVAIFDMDQFRLDKAMELVHPREVHICSKTCGCVKIAFALIYITFIRTSLCLVKEVK